MGTRRAMGGDGEREGGGMRRDVRVRRSARGREGGREGEGSINHRKKSLYRELRTWSQDTCHMQVT